jgi:hypothetical protein
MMGREWMNTWEEGRCLCVVVLNDNKDIRGVSPSASGADYYYYTDDGGGVDCALGGGRMREQSMIG